MLNIPLTHQEIADMVVASRQTRQEAHGAVDAVDKAAAGLMQGSRGLSERTEDEGSAIEQAAASIEQLARSVNRITNTAREAQRVVNLAGEDTGKRIEAATMVIAHMESIREARAGEQGLGFAVVAAEVRSLSVRCASSARQIKDLVSSASNRVLESTDAVDGSAENMAAINARIAEVNELMNGVVRAGSEQSAEICQVERTMAQMEHATRKNVGLVGQIVAATESLTAKTSRLATRVQDSSPGAQAPTVLRTPTNTEVNGLISGRRDRSAT